MKKAMHLGYEKKFTMTQIFLTWLWKNKKGIFQNTTSEQKNKMFWLEGEWKDSDSTPFGRLF